jgi:hypothetical protein
MKAVNNQSRRHVVMGSDEFINRIEVAFPHIGGKMGDCRA